MIKTLAFIGALSFGSFSHATGEGLEIVHEIMHLTGGKRVIQSMGANLAQAYVAMGTGPESKALAAFVQYNLDNYDLYGMTAYLVSEGLSEDELREVHAWYRSSPTYAKIKASQERIKGMPQAEAQKELMAFLQAGSRPGDDVRHMLTRRICDLSQSLALGRNAGHLSYALVRNFSNDRTPASATPQDTQVMREIEANVEQTLFLQTAFELKDLSEKDLRDYGEFLYTDAASKWHKAYTTYYFLGMKASFIKGLAALRRAQPPGPIAGEATL